MRVYIFQSQLSMPLSVTFEVNFSIPLHYLQLTDLLQKPLVSFMKEHLAGRLVTLKPDFSVTYNMTAEHARRLHSEVYAAGASMNLVFLDCNASCPEDLAPAKIHPHIIYVHIARQKVLRKLVQQMTANSRERDEQLQQAYHLYENSVSQHTFLGKGRQLICAMWVLLGWKRSSN